jgi:hypothetical protein
MVPLMRIDASNLILAAQVQAQRPAAAKAQQQAPFEPLDLAKASAPPERKTSAFQGPASRPGSQLDIKV